MQFTVEKSTLQRAAQLTLDMTIPGRQVDLSIVLGNDTFLQKLNQKYRREDAPTDVLSFPSGQIDPDTKGYYLGDVIISLPRAQEQALAEGHSLADELQLLVVHGTLHLLGFDHLKSGDKKRMQAAQDNIFKILPLNISTRL